MSDKAWGVCWCLGMGGVFAFAIWADIQNFRARKRLDERWKKVFRL